MLIVGINAKIGDIVIIVITFSIIPSLAQLCYFIFRNGNLTLRIALCTVYAIFITILNIVYYEYTYSYKVTPALVVLSIWGIGMITIIQSFTLRDNERLSQTAKVATKVSFVFIEIIVLALVTWGYFTADTRQIPIMLFVWWQLIFFAINCYLKAPLTKTTVNYIYK